jgi:hypothetical protein
LDRCRATGPSPLRDFPRLHRAKTCDVLWCTKPELVEPKVPVILHDSGGRVVFDMWCVNYVFKINLRCASVLLCRLDGIGIGGHCIGADERY